MSRFIARSTLSLISFVSAAVAVSISSLSGANTSHRSTEDEVALPRQRAAALLCPTIYSSRAYCPGGDEVRQLFITGQVIPAGFGQPVGYAQLNTALRAEYHLDAEPDYIFASGYLYAIDHRTKTVQRVIPVELAR